MHEHTDRAPGFTLPGLRPARFWTAFAAFWLLMALVAFASYLLRHAAIAEPVAVWPTLSGFLRYYLLTGLLVLPVLALARRLPFAPGRLASSWAAHLALGVCYAVVHTAAYCALKAVLYAVAQDTLPDYEYFTRKLLDNFEQNVFWYWVAVAFGHLFLYSGQVAHGELAGAIRDRRLAEARVKVLELQLQPVFMDDVLRRTDTLAARDPERADYVICRLGDWLRLRLESSAEQEVPLGRDLAFARAYLEIQRALADDAWEARIEVDADALDAVVPNLALQAMLELAWSRAPETDGARGAPEIAIARRGKTLVARVACAHAPAAAHAIDPVLLSAARDRLHRLYAGSAALETDTAAPAATTVTMRVPWHPRTGGQR